jgi:hypothetical protein
VGGFGLSVPGAGLESSLLTASASYAAQARAKARACSPGNVPLLDVTSSRVCLALEHCRALRDHECYKYLGMALTYVAARKAGV